MAVVAANLAADIPCPAHGEIEAKPNPEPSAIRTKVNAAATNAPAMMAGHDAADFPGDAEVPAFA
jgi:hypothetical protein